MKIIQVWTPYIEWEDWLNGMWRKVETGERDELLRQAIEFTGNWERYGAAMREVILAWPRTMLNHLTNTSINQRAFVGHCAVCFKVGMPESVTREAWKHLTDEQRTKADLVAQQAIDSWKIWNYNKRQLKILFPDYA